jgi:hypothetical protein
MFSQSFGLLYFLKSLGGFSAKVKAFCQETQNLNWAPFSASLEKMKLDGFGAHSVSFEKTFGQHGSLGTCFG